MGLFSAQISRAKETMSQAIEAAKSKLPAASSQLKASALGIAEYAGQLLAVGAGTYVATSAAAIAWKALKNTGVVPEPIAEAAPEVIVPVAEAVKESAPSLAAPILTVLTLLGIGGGAAVAGNRNKQPVDLDDLSFDNERVQEKPKTPKETRREKQQRLLRETRKYWGDTLSKPLQFVPKNNFTDPNLDKTPIPTFVNRFDVEALLAQQDAEIAAQKAKKEKAREATCHAQLETDLDALMHEAGVDAAATPSSQAQASKQSAPPPVDEDYAPEAPWEKEDMHTGRSDGKTPKPRYHQKARDRQHFVAMSHAEAEIREVMKELSSSGAYNDIDGEDGEYSDDEASYDVETRYSWDAETSQFYEDANGTYAFDAHDNGYYNIEDENEFYSNELHGAYEPAVDDDTDGAERQEKLSGEFSTTASTHGTPTWGQDAQALLRKLSSQTQASHEDDEDLYAPHSRRGVPAPYSSDPTVTDDRWMTEFDYTEDALPPDHKSSVPGTLPLNVQASITVPPVDDDVIHLDLTNTASQAAPAKVTGEIVAAPNRTNASVQDLIKQFQARSKENRALTPSQSDQVAFRHPSVPHDYIAIRFPHLNQGRPAISQVFLDPSFLKQYGITISPLAQSQQGQGVSVDQRDASSQSPIQRALWDGAKPKLLMCANQAVVSQPPFDIKQYLLTRPLSLPGIRALHPSFYANLYSTQRPNQTLMLLAAASDAHLDRQPVSDAAPLAGDEAVKPAALNSDGSNPSESDDDEDHEFLGNLEDWWSDYASPNTYNPLDLDESDTDNDNE